MPSADQAPPTHRARVEIRMQTTPLQVIATVIPFTVAPEVREPEVSIADQVFDTWQEALRSSEIWKVAGGSEADDHTYVAVHPGDISSILVQVETLTA